MIILFDELIYTHCSNGIDLRNHGKAIQGTGFKVYACSPELFGEHVGVDIGYLSDVAKTQLPYIDAGINPRLISMMENGYVYYVPDNGVQFLFCFHPFPHPGTYVNQGYVGSFTKTYPYELFGNLTLWNAQFATPQEYSQLPPSALARRCLGGAKGEYSSDRLSAFIEDGRADALRKAVCFLMEQYQKPVGQRKFLVIHDESTAHIEQWIAALESAFPPALAAMIPFATRMDNFADGNFYAVNSEGFFSRSNDPKQRRRKAMIVGVDARDVQNSGRLRKNSPQYVLLSGQEKHCYVASESSEIAAGDLAQIPYFSLISSFGDLHMRYCRTFLPMLRMDNLVDAYTYFDMFQVFMNPEEHTVQALVLALNEFTGRRTSVPRDAEQSSLLDEMCDSFISLFPDYFDQHRQSTLELLAWMDVTIQDESIKSELARTVAEKFCELFYQGDDSLLSSISELWSRVEQTTLKTPVALMLTEDKMVLQRLNDFKPRSTSASLAYLHLYLASAACAKKLSEPTTFSFLAHCLTLHKIRSVALMNEAYEVLAKHYLQEARALLLHLASAIVQQSPMRAEYLVFMLVTVEEQYIVQTDDQVLAFIDKLKKQRLLQVVSPVLQLRLEYLNRQRDEEGFAKIESFLSVLPADLHSEGRFSENCIAFFEALDKKIGVANPMHLEFAQRIYAEKPLGAKCSRATYVCLSNQLALLANEKGKSVNSAPVLEAIQNLAVSGLPSPMTATEENLFTERILDADLAQPEYFSLLTVLVSPLENSSYGCFTSFLRRLTTVSNERKSRQWKWFWQYAYDTDLLHNEPLRQAASSAFRAAIQSGESLWKKDGLFTNFDHSIAFKVIAFESLQQPLRS